ncbi:Isochorismatase-like protein [Microdochium trichocladiopsis]|uniref:nicotinamidase n=1 Tax=Microdochium trichocladiopsis TaxID=1682393 RepID=A0A9P8YAP3_9PEZI|nr:Isochorismatase-like protein [Microdochium trichocladiopsis]KAH7034569.1 Isochorismatase-like protein [Microdochium trichocladiopsis]
MAAAAAAAADDDDGHGAPFRPALLVVDLQEDFCPPTGSLAVPGGRAIAPAINKLLASPAFALRVATRDWHPENHISFAANHAGKQPFVDTVRVVNPLQAAAQEGEEEEHEAVESRLWPVHCVQNTPGAELIPELDAAKLDKVVDKGMDPRVEMYSPFFDPFTPLPAATGGQGRGQGQRRVCDSGLADLLASHDITHAYVVGLAADYCVQSAAVDAAKLGYVTYVVEDATRAVDAEAWDREGKKELQAKGVGLVGMGDQEVLRVLSS